MRKLTRILMLLTVLALVAPAAAQQTTTLLDVAAADGRFTTFVAAANASGVADALRSPGPLTVFAPTDEAFNAYMLTNAVSPEALLADTNALRAMLLNHMADGLVPTSAGDVALTARGGGPLVVTGAATGATVNGTAHVVFANIGASNGVLHAIDTVLAAATPAPALPAAEPAFVRVAHLSPDMPAVDIFVDGVLSGLTTLEYGDVSDWSNWSSAAYQLAFAPQGALVEEALFGPLSVTFAPGSWTTVTVIGSAREDTLRLAVIDQDVTAPLAAGHARVTLFDAIEGVGAVNLVVGDGIVLMRDLAPGEYGVLDVPAGDYDLQVTDAATGRVLVDLPVAIFDAGDFILLGATGTGDVADVVARTSTATEVVLLRGVPEVPDVVAVPQTTVFDVAVAQPDLSIFVTASQVTGLESVLREPGPLTVFAPTDSAFAALPVGTMDLLMERPTALTNLLRYHVVPGTITAGDLVAQPTADTILGLPLVFQLDSTGPRLNGLASVQMPDLRAANGIVHIIDQVLMPPLG